MQFMIPYVSIYYLGYDLSKVDYSNPQSLTAFYHKLIESMKFGYAQRSLLGDADFLPVENITKVCIFKLVFLIKFLL